MLRELLLQEYQQNQLSNANRAQLIALTGIGIAIATADSKLRN
jgi:flagellin-specific chaperone FliS